MKKIIIILIAILMSAAAYGQTAKEIIRTSEEKARGAETFKGEMTLSIVRPKWQRDMRMKIWSKGTDYALILVTAPARDKGTTNLKRGREVWNWVPRIERTIKLPPSMMSQSWMGSDFTNEDFVREFSLVKDYTHKLLKDSTIEGRECWKIELIPTEDASVVWGKIYMWISKKEHHQLRSEFYDEDDFLINVMQAYDLKMMGGREIASRMEIVPQEEEGHKTIITYHSMEFDKAISDNFFTIQNMKRIR